LIPVVASVAFSAQQAGFLSDPPIGRRTAPFKADQVHLTSNCGASIDQSFLISKKTEHFIRVIVPH
jgi:hypothetical protein